MKKIKSIILRWRYRRLYTKLFMLYAEKDYYADIAGSEASKAFQWITGYSWQEWFAKQHISLWEQSEDKAAD